MEIILDTNFIVACIKQKLDFFSKINEVTSEWVEWILPEQVLTELENISKRDGEKFEDKNSAAIGLEMMRLIEPKRIVLPKFNGNVDQAIIDFVKDRDFIVATLDRNLRNKIENKILTIKDIKKLEII